MRAPDLTAADYAEALSQLLPPGIVWPARDSGLRRVIDGLAPTVMAVHARAAALLDEAFPPTTLELLPEWEASFGLPDGCTDVATSTTERRNAVVARGGQSVPYIIQVAAALGFTVTVEEFTPFTAGGRAGTPLYGEAWAHTWRIRAPAVTVTTFRAGQSCAGDPLRAWGNEVLECVIGSIRPAHTLVLFAYGEE